MSKKALSFDSAPVLDPLDLRLALGCFGTGVTIVTARGADGRLAGLTANSFTSVSLDPPLVLWSLSMRSPSLSIFRDASHFAVNILGRHQEDLARRFGRPADDKFENVDWSAGRGGAPVLADTIAHFQCRGVEQYYGGDHLIFLGKVETYTHDSRDPLLFSRGTFGGFAETA